MCAFREHDGNHGQGLALGTDVQTGCSVSAPVTRANSRRLESYGVKKRAGVDTFLPSTHCHGGLPFVPADHCENQNYFLFVDVNG